MVTEESAPSSRTTQWISVAIPTMNRPDGLTRCVRSILAGRVLPLEIVVIDQSDGAETEYAIRALGDTAVPIVHHRDEKKGVSRSRNEGIRRARGAIVAFTDDDCVPEAGWLEAIDREFAIDPELGGVTGRVLPLGPDRPGFFAVSVRSDPERVHYRGRTIPWRVGTGGNSAVRKSWLERIGGFDERLGPGTPGKAAEDLDLLYRLTNAGASIVYAPDATVYHERKPATIRRASRPSYGYGAGMFFALHIARGDRYAIRLMGRWSWERVRSAARALARGRLSRVQEEALMLGGLLAGFRGAVGRKSPVASAGGAVREGDRARALP